MSSNEAKPFRVWNDLGELDRYDLWWEYDLSKIVNRRMTFLFVVCFSLFAQKIEIMYKPMIHRSRSSNNILYHIRTSLSREWNNVNDRIL